LHKYTSDVALSSAGRKVQEREENLAPLHQDALKLTRNKSASCVLLV
jgi:hypothetical protein